MEHDLRRGCLLEFVGSFGLVYFAGGVVCVNHLATALGQQTSQAALTGLQPGLLGVAFAYGMITAVLLVLFAAGSTGYANPAITLMLWVFGRLETRRTGPLLAAQLAGSLAAAGLLALSFERGVLQSAHVATPHLSSQAYPDLQRITLFTGVGIELVLTFFLVLAMFAPAQAQPTQARSREGVALASGAVVVASVLLAFPLTGAALNPARWFGPCCFEAVLGSEGSAPWADAVVYVAGPILGSLLAGLVCFRLLPPTPSSTPT